MKPGKYYEWFEDVRGMTHFFRIYVERDHSDNCPIKDDDPYWSNENKVVFRASDGTKRGSNVPWTRWRCNILDCPATILVSDSSIARMINRVIYLKNK